VDFFIHYAHLPASYFFPGQSLYLLWNALNDPLFGFLQDAGVKGRLSALRTRYNAVRWGGLAWAVSFLLIWFPPHLSSDSPALDGTSPIESTSPSLLTAIHFVVSICAYDAFLTWVEVSHSAILSEITFSDAERAEFNSYSAALAGFGSFSSFLGQYTWDRSSVGLYSFRLVMTLIAAASAAVFMWSASTLERASSHQQTKATTTTTGRNLSAIIETGVDDDDENKVKRPQGSRYAPAKLIAKFSRFVRDLRHHPNFWFFTIVSCIQSFDCAFEKSSFAVMLERLSDDTLGHATRGLIISASFFLPWLFTLMLTPQVQQHGVYHVLKLVFATRLLICFFGFVHSAKSESAAPFLLLNRVTSELVCRMSPLVISDLVDEDRFLNRRTLDDETRAGTLVGSLHFFTKITSSLGPMMSFTMMKSALPSPLLRLVFALIPSACVAMQMTIWTLKFQLKDSYLFKVKDYVLDLAGQKEARLLEEQQV